MPLPSVRRGPSTTSAKAKAAPGEQFSSLDSKLATAILKTGTTREKGSTKPGTTSAPPRASERPAPAVSSAVRAEKNTNGVNSTTSKKVDMRQGTDVSEIEDRPAPAPTRPAPAPAPMTNGASATAGPRMLMAKSMKIYDDVKKGQKDQVKFVDDKKQQVMFELTDKKIMNFFVSGKLKVQAVKTLSVVDGNVFHVKGKTIMSSDCTATLPESMGADAIEKVVFDAMELFARRALANTDEQRLIVTVISARGLRDADAGIPGQGVSDPYCIASVQGKPESRMQTKYMKDTLEPVWNHMGEVSGWVPGDMVQFDLWDKDWCSRDDYLGHAELALEDKNNLPQWEGELLLKDAGPGIEAYLKVVVISGTRLIRASNKVLDCLQDASCTIDSDLLGALLESAAEAGMTGENVEKGRLLVKLMRARVTDDANEIRTALKAAQHVSLDFRPEYHEAVQFVAMYDAMLMLHQAEFEHRSLGPLTEAIDVAKQAGCSSADLKRYKELSINISSIGQAGESNDLAQRTAAVQLAYKFELTQWKEFKSLAMKCLRDAPKRPMLAELEQAVKVGQDVWASEGLMDPCTSLLAAMQRLDKTVKSRQKRFNEIYEAILNVEKAAGTSDVDSPEIANAWMLLKGCAKEALDDVLLTPSKDALIAAIKDAELAQLAKADTLKATNMVKALESLSAALKVKKADVLRTAVETADSAGLPKDCFQYSSAKAQLEALEGLTKAKASKRKTLMASAIEKAQEAGLSTNEFGEVESDMKNLRMQQQLLDNVKKATKIGPLEQAIEAAENFDLGDRPEIKEGKLRVVQLKAYEQLLQATSSAEPNIRQLQEALEAARICKLDDEDCPIVEAKMALHSAKKMLAKEEGKRVAREHLKEATDSLSDLDPAVLSKAIKECKDVDLPKVEYHRAEDLLRALKLLQSVVNEEHPDQIRRILEDTTVLKLHEMPEYKQAAERLKIKEMQQKAMDLLAEALKEDTSDALRHAIKEAKRAGIEERVYAKHVQQLAKLEVRELELQKAAEVRLKEAMKPTATMEALEQAVKNAEAAKLSLSNEAFREASELLMNKKEVIRDLTNSYSEKALAKAIMNAQKFGLESTPEYKEAKLQLQKAKETSMKSQHAENARKQLEAAIESPVTRDGLERAIRAARVVQISNNEPLMQRALVLLKEIMQQEAVKLANKIKAGLANKTLDRDRIDVMMLVKAEIFSCHSAAKLAGVAEIDLEELERVRKKVHNIVEDLKGSIRVFVRVRPLSKKEIAQGDIDVVTMIDPMTLEVAQLQKGVDNTDKATKFQFQYDAVFTPGSQEQVFADCKELVQSVLDGYNITIFAYGQTGAGKTFTMAGEPGNEGLSPRTIDELFKVMDANKFRCTYSVKAQIMELYCNEYTDLLRPKNSKDNKPIEVKWRDETKEVIVENCITESVPDAASLHDLLARGTENRKTAQTLMNHESSRSHLIFTIYVSCVHKDTNEKFKGKIVTVDLAGCERLKKSGAQGQQSTEAIEINKSLTALVDVIEALVTTQAAERKNAKEGKTGKVGFVPYRNHRLTQLLQDSLGGAAKTLMFVNCSPAGSNCQETIAALRYGQRAKNVTNIRQVVQGGVKAGDAEDMVSLLRSDHGGGRSTMEEIPDVEDDAAVERKLKNATTAFLIGAAMSDSDED